MINRKLNIFCIAMLTTLGFSSCLDVVDVDLDEGVPQLAVDAFINNQENPEVVLTLTNQYFDSSESTFVSDASVSISDGTTVYDLTFEDNAYRFNSPVVTAEGLDYKLMIEHDGNSYEALSTTQPVPPLLDDSILFEFEEAAFGIDSGYIAEIRAYDIFGRDDYYWIRYYRNDTLVNDPSNLILAKDAAFGGTGTDGFLFITPIRTGINDFTRFYQLGENVKVEIWAIEEDTWQFLSEVVEQSSIGGPLAIISPPTYNLRSNITHVSGDAELPAIGYFSASMVSKNEAVVQE